MNSAQLGVDQGQQFARMMDDGLGAGGLKFLDVAESPGDAHGKHAGVPGGLHIDTGVAEVAAGIGGNTQLRLNLARRSGRFRASAAAQHRREGKLSQEVLDAPQAPRAACWTGRAADLALRERSEQFRDAS